jgi:CBS domain-containing protein
MEAMFETLTTALVYTLIASAGVGLTFALVFVWSGVERLDSEAKAAGIGFRLLILPDVAAFWTLLLQRWLRGITHGANQLEILPVVNRADVHKLEGIVTLRDVLNAQGVSRT